MQGQQAGSQGKAGAERALPCLGRYPSMGAGRLYSVTYTRGSQKCPGRNVYGHHCLATVQTGAQETALSLLTALRARTEGFTSPPRAMCVTCPSPHLGSVPFGPLPVIFRSLSSPSPPSLPNSYSSFRYWLVLPFLRKKSILAALWGVASSDLHTWTPACFLQALITHSVGLYL